MTVVVVTLLFLSFLQGALLPLDLVLMFILVRSFITYEKANLLLALGFGLLLAILLDYPLGSLSLIYLGLVEGVHIFRQTRLAAHPVAVLPLVACLLFLNRLTAGVLLQTTMDWRWLVAEIALVLPFYFALRLWEERFVVKQDLRLKVGK